MPTVTVYNSITANTTTADVFSGKRTTQLPAGGTYLVSYSSNAQAGGIEEAVFVGGANPIESSAVAIATTVGNLDKEDFVGSFVAQGGETITASVTNTTGTNYTHMARISVEQIG